MSDSEDDEAFKSIPASRITAWEKVGVDIIEGDLATNGGIRYVGGPPKARQQAMIWVRVMKRKRAQGVEAAKREMVTLKPSFMGMGADLKEMWRRFVRWRKGSS